MAGKLIPLNEAAETLGVSAEELTEMRTRGEIHGYRDGSSWKFKESELERVAGELADGGSLGGDSFDGGEDDGGLIDLDDITLDASDEPLEGSSILVSEQALGTSSGASSIIGGDRSRPTADSDIELASESSLDLDDGSDLKLSGSGIGLGDGDSDVSLAADEEGSDVKLVPGGSDVMSEDDADFVTDSDVLADSGEQKVGTSDTGRLSDGDLDLEEDDALELATGDSLALGDDDLLLDEGSSASALDLDDDDDDDDLVLSGSGIGSDVTLGAGDSGIGLANPSESGLDLEDATLDLGGSAVDSLELPEDEDDDVISLDGEADPDAATQLKADADFLLTPVEDEDMEDESGSQVIALEDSEAYDADASTLLGAGGDQPLVASEDSDMFGQQLQQYNQPAGGAAQPMPMPAHMYPAMSGPPEAGYSIWNVLALMLALLPLLFAGLLMVDLVNNMWEAHDVGQGSTWIMDTVVDAFGLN
jgi:excisionase family DNA binding protein